MLDRVQALGATAIATSPYVLEPAPDGEGGREPPIDAGAGSVRPLDRPLFGRRELWVRTAPSFVHDGARYAGLRYQPSPPTALTLRDEAILDRVVERASARGIEVLLQVMAASPPGYRVQFSSAHEEDHCLLPDGRAARGARRPQRLARQPRTWPATWRRSWPNSRSATPAWPASGSTGPSTRRTTSTARSSTSIRPPAR